MPGNMHVIYSKWVTFDIQSTKSHFLNNVIMYLETCVEVSIFSLFLPFIQISKQVTFHSLKNKLVVGKISILTDWDFYFQKSEKLVGPLKKTKKQDYCAFSVHKIRFTTA